MFTHKHDLHNGRYGNKTATIGPPTRREGRSGDAAREARARRAGGLGLVPARIGGLPAAPERPDGRGIFRGCRK